MEKIARTFVTHKFEKFSGVETPRYYKVELIDYYLHLKDWYLTAETETYQWLVDNVEKEWSCIEVGGHVGETSILLSQLGKVIFSFEPNPVSCDKFRNNIEHNQRIGDWQFLNVQLIPRPVGNKDGIRTEKLWLAGKDRQFGETVGEYNFITIDRFLGARDDIRWISLIFVDADGWDYDVLMGAEFVVNKCHPYIIMEANYALGWRGHTIEEVYNWADMHKYDCVFLDAACPGNILLVPNRSDVDDDMSDIYHRE